jgi:hypothetical protein
MGGRAESQVKVADTLFRLHMVIEMIAGYL